MSNSNIRKNFVFNTAYQILLIIIPLITVPYISHIFAPDMIGKVSFYEASASYFVLFANMGINVYGQRAISCYQNDLLNRSRIFWELKLLSIIVSCPILLVYIFYAFMQSNPSLSLVFAINIFSIIFDVSWLYQGLEIFDKMAIRNGLVKLTTLLFIFILVKNNNNVLIYAFLLTLSTFLCNISMWIGLSKYVILINIKDLSPFQNLRTILSLFIPTIAMQVYLVMDKTMIGLITEDLVQNGYYEQATKTAKVALTIITSLGTVMIPRITSLYSQGNQNNVIQLMVHGYRFVWFLGFPICFGLIGIASNFVPWFYGTKYTDVIPLLKILACLVLAIGINNMTGIVYLISTKRQNTFTLTVCIGAITNFLCNLMLIPHHNAIGASYASVIAETTIAIIQLVILRNELPIFNILASAKNYLLISTIMLLVLLPTSELLPPSLLSTTILIILGTLIYLLGLVLVKDTFFFNILSRNKVN